MRFKEWMENFGAQAINPGMSAHKLDVKSAKLPKPKSQMGTAKAAGLKPARPAGISAKPTMTIPSAL